MTAFVLDASVIVQVFVPEEHSHVARQLFVERHELHAPDLIAAELGNALRNMVRRDLMTSADAEESAVSFRALDLTLHPCTSMLTAALQFANRFDRSVYDSLYVVLAQELGAPLITADRRLFNAVAPSLPQTILMLEDALAET